MKINIEIAEALSGHFSDVKLCFNDLDGSERKVTINIDFLPLHDFVKNTSSIQFDFFLISAIVYGVDNLLDRYIYSIDGWAREIEIDFPVNNNNLAVWAASNTQLQEVLAFLTGDHWSISFSNLKIKSIFKIKKKRWSKNIPRYNKSQYQFVSLFSGGLDSLIGVIDRIEELNSNSKILLSSHFDSSSVGPNSDQTKLEKYLSTKYPNKVSWIQSSISLSHYDSNGIYLSKESSYRSRSILFIGIGSYLLSSLPTKNILFIPENGTISLNYPLTPSRASSLSTRTTHPYFLSKLQELFKIVNSNVELFNPYINKTKGEIVTGCRNRVILKGIYKDSVSCGKRGRKQNWEIKYGTQHCGVCMPCIYRRAALHKLKWDDQLYGNDLLNSTNPENYVDMPALFDYLKTSLNKEKIARDLLVNGSLPLAHLEQYADVIVNSRKEIIKWIKDKGNSNIKNILGIR